MSVHQTPGSTQTMVLECIGTTGGILLFSYTTKKGTVSQLTDNITSRGKINFGGFALCTQPHFSSTLVVTSHDSHVGPQPHNKLNAKDEDIWKNEVVLSYRFPLKKCCFHVMSL